MDRCFTLMDEQETKRAWAMVDNFLHFNPSIKDDVEPFVISTCYEIYDISKVNLLTTDDNEKEISLALSNCMSNDDYIYALDWQHSCFRFDPRIQMDSNSIFVCDDRYMNGGYNAYFPDYYPDGDYYFFISTDFDWGYLGHPWLKKVWIFGNKLVHEFDLIHEKIGYVKCNQ